MSSQASDLKQEGALAEPNQRPEGTKGGGPPATPGGGTQGGSTPGGGSWDGELAWHDEFRRLGGGAMVPGAGLAAAPSAEPSRWALIGEALRDGAGTGFARGVSTLAIDTTINVLTSRIPYLQGGVELVRFIKDPASLKNTFNIFDKNNNNIAKGVDQILKGDWCDKIEGVVNFVDGVNSIIGTLSSICWVVAGAGFLISLVFPALLPFVAMAAQWAMTLGKISTVIGIFVSVARAVVVLLRMIDMLTAEASPEELRAKQAALQGQVEAFTTEFTTRAGASLRDRASGHINRALINRQRATAGQPPLPPPAAPPQVSRLSRAIGIVTGAWGGAGQRFGAGEQQARREMLDSWHTALSGTRALGQGGLRMDREATAARLDAVEGAGVQVYVSQAHRERTQRQVQTPAAPDPVPQLTAARQRYQQALAELERAKWQRSEAKGRLDERRRELAEAQRRLREAEQQHGSAIRQAEHEVNERRALVDACEADVRKIRSQLDLERQVAEQARAMHDWDQANGKTGQYRQMVEEHEHNVRQLEQRLRIEEQAVADAREYYNQGLLDLEQARQPVTKAKQSVSEADQGVRSAQKELNRADAARHDAYRFRGRARQELGQHDTPANRAAQEQHRAALAERQARREAADTRFREQQEQAAGYRAATDFGGNGPGAVYGQNKGSGYTGAGVELVRAFAQDLRSPEEVEGNKDWMAERTKDLFSGMFDDSTPARRSDASGQESGPVPAGTSSQAAGGVDLGLQGRVQAKLAAIAAALPAPPLEAAREAAQAEAQLAEARAQGEALAERQQAMAQLRQEAQEQVQTLDVLQQGVTQTQGRVDAQRGELQGKQRQQQLLLGKAGEAQCKVGELQGQAGESQGLVGGFIGGFLQLMGMVPSRIVSGASQGAAMAQRLQQGSQQQSEAAQAGQAGAQALQGLVRQMQSETQGLSGQNETLGSRVTALGQDVAQKHGSAQEGLAGLGQTAQQTEAGMAENQSEIARLQQVHAGAVQRQKDWAQTHFGVRESHMAELDALVAEADL